jgi:ABC-type bacteriocin/lantibiotic exporter with double-glycine peptidase domain
MATTEGEGHTSQLLQTTTTTTTTNNTTTNNRNENDDQHVFVRRACIRPAALPSKINLRDPSQAHMENSFIGISGMIGAGKTTLAKRLSQLLGTLLLLLGWNWRRDCTQCFC